MIRILLAMALLFGSFTGWSGQPYILILGVAQDGGYPHAGCQRECCAAA